MPSVTSSEKPPFYRRHFSIQDGSFLAVLAGLLLWLGWGKWTHPIIDFGRELYVPWQIGEGQTLYRDLAYFNGPLSPYFNAAGMKLLGAQLSTLLTLNIVVLAVSILLTYSLVRRLTGRLEAVVASVVFLCVFATADLIGFGNYNFLTPYSHEMTHGIALSLGLLWVFTRYLITRTRGALLVSGLVLGLIFLTKAEFFVAAGAAVGLTLAVDSSNRGDSLRELGRRSALLVASSLVPIAIAWGLLVTALGIGAATIAVLGSWPYLFLEGLRALPFYRQGMGLDAPAASIIRMLSWCGVYLIALGPSYWLARRLSPRSARRLPLSLAAGGWTLIAVVGAGLLLDPTDFPRPLSPVALIAVVVTIQALRREPLGSGQDRLAGLLALEVFALLLLAKMALHPRFQHYGFALALPATMVLVVVLLFQIPVSIDRRGGYGPAFRFGGLVFLVVMTVGFSLPSQAAFRQKTLDFGSGGDQILIHPRFLVMQQLLDRLEEEVGEDETLLVLPEGVMLNFQIRRATPTRYLNFMPPEFVMFGEEDMLEAFEQTPPDVIVLVKRSVHEYGFESFGAGYGERIVSWMERSGYRVMETISEPQLDRFEFGRALILRRLTND